VDETLDTCSSREMSHVDSKPVDIVSAWIVRGNKVLEAVTEPRDRCAEELLDVINWSRLSDCVEFNEVLCISNKTSKLSIEPKEFTCSMIH
jgi:hypothetical protein